MKIYRFVPDSSFRWVNTGPGVRWWPDGYDLGGVVPISNRKSTVNRYESRKLPYLTEQLPLSDFPGLALNVPVISVRGSHAVSMLSGVSKQIEIVIDDEPFYAIQPPILNNTINWQQSEWIEDPLENKQLLLLKRRMFNESQITADIFWIREQVPLSDVYLTERFVRTAEKALLSGLGALELVYVDGQPVVPSYTPIQSHNLTSIRYRWEAQLLAARCELAFMGSEETVSLIDDLYARGLLKA